MKVQWQVTMIEDAVSKIRRGNCILFTGAGFSVGLPNFLDEEIPQVSGLIDHFLDIAKITDDRRDYDLESASSAAFADNHDAAFAYIQKAFRCKRSDNDRLSIATQPWRRVYTANYDDAFEVSAHETKLSYSTLDISDIPSTPPKGSIQVVHIHGSIARLTEDNFREYFYLTDEQSRDIAFDRSSWRRIFLEDLTYCDAAFFVGFSNSDFHIRRLLDSVRHLSSKIFFVTANHFSKPASQRIAAYGTYSPIGVQGFSALTQTAKKPEFEEPAIPQCFIERSYPRDIEALATRDDVHLELLLGTIDPLNFGRSGAGGYYFDRIAARHMAKLADARGTFVFFADVGNGKTTIAHQVASQFFRRGRKIFQYIARKYDVEEVRSFISQFSNSVFIVENISLNYDIIKLIQDASNNSLVLSTDRTKRLELS